METLKDLPRTTIMVPDLTTKHPCIEELVPVVHITEDDLRDVARGYAKKIIKDMVIDSSKIGPLTINERGVLTLEIGITSNNVAMNQAIGMLAFIKHFFNLEPDRKTSHNRTIKKIC